MAAGYYTPALLLDPAGDLYGTTFEGGDAHCYGGYGNGSGCGVVYKIVQPRSGKSPAGKETVLYAFEGGGVPWAPPGVAPGGFARSCRPTHSGRGREFVWRNE
jgi:hypothetical protein